MKDLEQCLSQLAGKIKPNPWGRNVLSLNHGLHFSGGEPFLNFDLLLKATEIAHDLKIPSLFVETNCSWCTSDEITREKLQRLKKTNLIGILISVNPFFAEYIPFERTERCIRISKDIFGENVAIYQLEYYHLFKKLGIKDKISLEDFIKLTPNEYLSQRVELFLMGRAARQLRDLYPGYPANIFFHEPCRPPFLRNWHNHWDNYGNFIPGYCGGISLGSWRNLDELIIKGINLENFPILSFLISGDFSGLFQFANKFDYQESKMGYISKCDLCLDMRKYLVSQKNFKELSPKEFYSHLDDFFTERGKIDQYRLGRTVFEESGI